LAVVDVLRDFITGKEGQNILLKNWVDDLSLAAKDAIEKSGEKVRALTTIECDVTLTLVYNSPDVKSN
jgi:hypothetical protein